MSAHCAVTESAANAAGRGPSAVTTTCCPPSGVLVLVSTNRYDDPEHWYIAETLWSDPHHTLIECAARAGEREPSRFLIETPFIRAFGAYSDLYAFRKAVETETAAIRAPLKRLEDGAAEARARVWKVLDRSFGAVASPGGVR